MAFTNLDYLRTITEGDTESIRELIILFIEQVPEFIENLNKFLKEKRYAELGNEAHKAKSSVMIMGMDDLGHDMKRLHAITCDPASGKACALFIASGVPTCPNILNSAFTSTISS